MKKIILTGATGYIGRHILAFLVGRYEIYAVVRSIEQQHWIVDYPRVHFVQGDIVDKKFIETIFLQVQPNIVLHTAAMSKPDECEQYPVQAFEVNVEATAYIASCCKQHQAHLVFLSTDMLFNKAQPIIETDCPNPINHYGKTKMWAEEAILATACKATILRLLLVYGKVLPYQRNTFVQWIQTSVQEKKHIHVYTHQQKNILYINDFLRALESVLFKELEGIFHIAGGEVFTMYEIAMLVADYLQLDKQYILPAKETLTETIVHRPQTAILNIDKAKYYLDYQPTKLSLAIAQIFS